MRRRVELHERDLSIAVRRPQHRDVRAYALEPHDAIHGGILRGPLALQLEPELGEEPDRGREIVHHDAYVIHPLDSHESGQLEQVGSRAWRPGNRLLHSVAGRPRQAGTTSWRQRCTDSFVAAGSTFAR